jgi:hypothetical protein
MSAPSPVSVLEIVEARIRKARAILAVLPKKGRLRRDEAIAEAYWLGHLDLANLLLPILEQHEAQVKAMREKLREAEINNP